MSNGDSDPCDGYSMISIDSFNLMLVRLMLMTLNKLVGILNALPDKEDQQKRRSVLQNAIKDLRFPKRELLCTNEQFDCEFVKISAATSSYGGIYMDIGSRHVYVRWYSSVRGPLVPMALEIIADLTAFGRLSQQSLKCIQRSPNLTSLPQKKSISMTEFTAMKSARRSNNPLLLKLCTQETAGIPRPAYSGACRSPTTDANGNRESNNITSSEGACSLLTGGNRHRGTDPTPEDNPVVILDSGAPETITGNLSVLSSGTIHRPDGVLPPASGETMQAYTGSVCFGRFRLSGVKYNPRAGNRIVVSVSELDMLGYYVELDQGNCIVLDIRSDEIVGKGRLVDEDYLMEYLQIPHDRASESESQFSLE